MGFLDFFRKKKPPVDSSVASGKAAAEYATRHSFVLCRNEVPSDLSHMNEVVAQVFGSDHSAEIDDGKKGITITKGEESVGFLAHIPAPIPNHEAEENADGNFLWTDGRAEAAKHRSHIVIVSAVKQTPLQSALTVSRLTLVALKLFDGIGVYWGNARVSNSREVFEDFCDDISEDKLPIPMWLRFQPVRTPDNRTGLYTIGMQQFGLMDIEVDRCGMKLAELFEFVSNIALYLIQSGPVIKDGNTIGGSEDERILVRHRASMIDKQRTVYKIVFEE